MSLRNEALQKSAIVGAVAAGAVALWGAFEGIHLPNFGALLPHEHADLEAKSALSSITEPADLVINRGAFDTSVTMETYKKFGKTGIGPLDAVVSVANYGVKWVTDRNYSSEGKGHIEILLANQVGNESSLTLAPYCLKYAGDGKCDNSSIRNYGVQATVDVRAISAHPTDICYGPYGSANVCKSSSTPSLLDAAVPAIKVVQHFFGGDNTGQRQEAANETAVTLGVYDCGRVMGNPGNLAAGIQQAVYYMLRDNAYLAARIPGGGGRAKFYESAMLKPIPVNFKDGNTGATPNQVYASIAAAPQNYVSIAGKPTKDMIAKRFGMSSDSFSYSQPGSQGCPVTMSAAGEMAANIRKAYAAKVAAGTAPKVSNPGV